MARKSKAGLSDVLFKLAAVLPWWGGVALAGVSYVVLHHYAIAEVPAVTVPGEVGRMAVGQMVKVLASVGQYLVPLVLLAGAVASWQGRRKRQGLVSEVARDASGQALRAMSWRDFELLVGEVFRLRGYAVTETGGGGADGGIDLSLRKDGETFLVQCKQWRAYKVPVNIVRELFGVMAAEGASGGFVVSSGVFTAEAQAFAKGRNIELIDGAALTQTLKQARLAAPLAPLTPASGLIPEPPTCPLCGSQMAKRLAKQGINTGKAFWGCSTFPKCRGVCAIG